MKKTLFLSVLAVAAMSLTTNIVFAAGGGTPAPRQSWSWDGVFGTYDRAEAQRGLQVYKEVCAGCHGLRLVAYRNLIDLGFTKAQVKALAAEFEVTDGPNDEGEMFTRPAKPSDRFVSPFPNENAARAGNNGALPPDLSLIVDARAFGMDFISYTNSYIGGADYVYGLLTGYVDPPSNTKIGDGMYYNKYFAGQQIAMAPPLLDDGVEYTDGTKATVQQMARDVTTFLAWASEPNLEQRKGMGLKVILFLVAFLILIIAVKKRVWSNVH